jgi:hypothetical protein
MNTTNKIILRTLIFVSFLIFVAFSCHSLFIKSNYESLKNDNLKKTSFEERYKIHFIETNERRTELTTKQLCAIESAARNNPNAAVIIHSLTARAGAFSFVFDAYPNLVLKELNIIELFTNTPLQKWLKHSNVSRSEHAIAHLSDAARLVILSNQGGFYSDLDTITLKSVENLTEFNGAGYIFEDGGDSLGSGVLIFRANHPFLEYMIKRMVSNYDPNVWGSPGPLMLIGAMKEFCEIDDIYTVLAFVRINNKTVTRLSNSAKNSTQEKLCDLKIFPQNYFYPYNYRKDLQGLFEKNSASRLKSDLGYSVHFYGYLSKQFRVIPGEFSIYDHLASLNCPRVYEYVKSNDLFFQ